MWPRFRGSNSKKAIARHLIVHISSRAFSSFFNPSISIRIVLYCIQFVTLNTIMVLSPVRHRKISFRSFLYTFSLLWCRWWWWRVPIWIQLNWFGGPSINVAVKDVERKMEKTWMNPLLGPVRYCVPRVDVRFIGALKCATAFQMFCSRYCWMLYYLGGNLASNVWSI